VSGTNELSGGEDDDEDNARLRQPFAHGASSGHGMAATTPAACRDRVDDRGNPGGKSPIFNT
jgi:hypothetical protein